MIYSYQELLLKYKDYKNSKTKINREIRNGTYIPISKGIYTDDEHIDGAFLAQVIVSPSYLSFEYALSYYGMIPERVTSYTSSTTLKKHNKRYRNFFGNYFYSDVPVDVFNLGVKRVSYNGHFYLIASKEKALCDLMYKKPPVYSLKQLKELLLEDLRIDEDELYALNKDDIIKLCPLYKKRNLNFLMKLMMEVNKDE